MAIVDTINSIKVNVENAYTSLENKGATIPNKKNIQNLSSTIESIQAGGGGDSPIQNSGGKYLVRVVDYDGTILKEDWLNTGATFTLPNPPTHDRLIFEEWSSPVDIVDNAITVPNYDVIIGPLYNTKSGLSEFDIVLNNATGLSIYFMITGVKDWGDGTTDSANSHTYPSAGKYTIKMDITNIDVVDSIMNASFDETVENILLSSKVDTIGEMAFYQLRALKTISFPKKIVNFGLYALRGNYLLKSIIMPYTNDGTACPASLFQECTQVENVVIPKSWDGTKGRNIITNAYRVDALTIPKSTGKTLPSTFIGTTGPIRVINILSDLTTINASAFANLTATKEIRFIGCTSVPTLSSTNVFTSLFKKCKVFVPDNLYDSWKTKTNWTTIANQIYKLSEVEQYD